MRYIFLFLFLSTISCEEIVTHPSYLVTNIKASSQKIGLINEISLDSLDEAPPENQDYLTKLDYNFYFHELGIHESKDKVILDEVGRYLVVNENDILFFDTEGYFIAKFNELVDDSISFTKITSVHLDEDNNFLYIADFEKIELYKYDSFLNKIEHYKTIDTFLYEIKNMCTIDNKLFVNGFFIGDRFLENKYPLHEFSILDSKHLNSFGIIYESIAKVPFFTTTLSYSRIICQDDFLISTLDIYPIITIYNAKDLKTYSTLILKDMEFVEAYEFDGKFSKQKQSNLNKITNLRNYDDNIIHLEIRNIDSESGLRFIQFSINVKEKKIEDFFYTKNKIVFKDVKKTVKEITSAQSTILKVFQ